MRSTTTVNGLRVIALAVLCAGWGAACAKHRGPEAGTNTNWLKQCDADADCDGDGDCLCGVCTKTCTGRSECSALGSEVSCTAVDEATCGTSATGSVCLPEQGPPSDSGALDAGASDSGTSGSGRTLIRVGAEVRIPDDLRACTSDADCTLVDTSCNGCCEQGAIRRSEEQYFHDNFEQACSTGERGPICRCLFEPLAPRCENQRCTAVARDPLRDCYSPTQNTEQAYDPRSIGCACPQVGLQICTSNAAMTCSDDGTGVLQWKVDRGPCGDHNPDCPVNARRPDATSCLAEFSFCFERQGGGFCGGGCLGGPLDCAEVPCQYTAAGDCMMNVGRWEGVCGNVRWRAESGGFGGPTWYWDNDSGELLAVTYSSDFNSACNGSEAMTTSGDFTVVQSCEVVLDATTVLCPFP